VRKRSAGCSAPSEDLPMRRLSLPDSERQQVVFERRSPGHDVMNFVMLHLGLHEEDRGDPDRLADYYAEARQAVIDLAAIDLELCLSLLADLAGHFAKTLEHHTTAATVEAVVNDWAGRGWAPSVRRAGAIRAVRKATGRMAAAPATGIEKPRPAGEPAPF
jgi:hypothetical protein